MSLLQAACMLTGPKLAGFGEIGASKNPMNTQTRFIIKRHIRGRTRLDTYVISGLMPMNHAKLRVINAQYGLSSDKMSGA